MFSWFDASEAQQLAIRLANEFSRAFPVSNKDKEDKKTLAKRDKATELVFAQAELFVRKTPLNIYKKARFGQAFQAHLAGLGYEIEFTRGLTRDVLLHLR
ncbi:hypothetical protein [Zoogloea sp.]|uniref:hypothetical protein n=1 Tax=Zoogloea sp. TaxID=49181 RepID=UPI0035B0EDAB